MQQPSEYYVRLEVSGPHVTGYQLTAAIRGLGAMLMVRVMAVSWIVGSLAQVGMDQWLPGISSTSLW
jgi:hypothetical protein